MRIIDSIKPFMEEENELVKLFEAVIRDNHPIQKEEGYGTGPWTLANRLVFSMRNK